MSVLSLEALVLVESDFDLDVLLADAEALDLSLVEAVFTPKTFDEKKHPRWPKGTERAGQFMKVGQYFSVHGVQYEVANIVKSGVVAHEASGSVAAAKTVKFVPTKAGTGLEIAGVQDPTPKMVTGGKHSSDVTVISPYVDHASHDPSIPKPDELTAEQWKRFGKVDQEHYIDLQERFGSWSPGAAQAIHDKAYAAADKSVVSVVKSAFKSQYGSSSGTSLSLTSLFSGYDLEGSFKKREKAKELQGELMEVIQWDLYNRTQSPDIALVHKTSDAPPWWKSILAGQKPVFSGLSQTFHYSPGAFGSHGIVTPTAIRHILMSSYSALPCQTGYAGELEVSVPFQLKLDPAKSFAFSNAGMSNAHALTQSQSKWYQGITKTPQGGAIVDMLRDSIHGKGDLPVPPQPANIQIAGQGGKQWLDPPPAAAALTKGWKVPPVQTELYEPAALAALDLDIEFKLQDENGVPKLLSALDSGFMAGDFMLGKRGTLYWVGSDPGDPTGYGLMYHEIKDGMFVGKQFNFGGGGTSKFYRLSQHFAEPKIAAEPGQEWDPHAWVNTKEQHFVSKLHKGDKFKVAGNGYELTADPVPGGATVGIKVLATGKLGTINTDYKTPIIVPKAGYVLKTAVTAADQMTAGQQIKEDGPGGQKMITASGENGLPEPVKWTVSLAVGAAGAKTYTDPVAAWEAFKSGEHVGPKALVFSPQAGDVFPWEGKKHTITSVLKDGRIRAKAQGESTVTTFTPGHGTTYDDIVAAGFFRPDEWLHNPGQKVKLSSLAEGDIFDVGTGAKLRPAVVTGHTGSVVKWKSLETGVHGESMGHKAVRQIVPKGEVGDTTGGVPSEPSVAAAEGKFDASKYVEQGSALWKDIPDGGLFMMVGKPYKRLNANAALNLLTNKPVPSGWLAGKDNPDHPIHTKQLPLLVAKDEQVGPFDYAAAAQGDQVQLNYLQVGDQFYLPTIGGSEALWQVQKAAGDESHPAVMQVLGKNAYGPVTPLSFATTVTLHKKAGDPDPVALAPPGVVDADAFPSALGAGFSPYKSAYGSGAKYKHPMLKDMPAGTHFRDTQGNVWIVKHSGLTSVITDGEANFSVDGKLRGRVLDTKTLIDSSPPLVDEPVSKGAWDDVSAVEGKTIGDFAFVKGDKFAHAGEVYEVNYVGFALGTGISTVFAKGVTTGSELGFMGNDPVSHVSAGAEPAAPPPELSWPEGWKQADLPVGTKFSSDGGAFGVWEVTAPLKITLVESGPETVNAVGDTITLDDQSVGHGIPAGWTPLFLPPTPTKFGDLSSGDEFTLPGDTTVWKATGIGSIAGWAVNGSGEQKKLTLGTPIVAKAAAPDLFDVQVGSFVTLKVGTLYNTPADEQFKVVDNVSSGEWVLDNNMGGEVIVDPESIASVQAPAPPPVGFPVGVAVGPGHTWAETRVGDTFQSGTSQVAVTAKSPDGMTVTVAYGDLDGDHSLTLTPGTSIAHDMTYLGKVHAGQPGTSAADSTDAYVGDDFWPDAEPLPKVGDTVWYIDAENEHAHAKGVVGDILPSGEYGINPDAGGHTVWVPEHDLLRPGGAEQAPTAEIKWFSVGAHAWTLGGKHGIVKEDPINFEKYLLLDDGTTLVPGYELYPVDPVEYDFPVSPDPAAPVASVAPADVLVMDLPIGTTYESWGQTWEVTGHEGGYTQITSTVPGGGTTHQSASIVIKASQIKTKPPEAEVPSGEAPKPPDVIAWSSLTPDEQGTLESRAKGGPVVSAKSSWSLEKAGLIVLVGDKFEVTDAGKATLASGGIHVPPEPAAGAQQVYSAGVPMVGAEGQPIMKGQEYALKFGIGSPEYATALGSGNAPGTVMVQFGDGGKSEFEPHFFFADDSAPSVAASDPLVPYKSSYGPGGKYTYDPIGSLVAGTKFKGKGKEPYWVVSHMGPETTFRNEAGDVFTTSEKNRVRVLADPPPEAPPQPPPEAYDPGTPGAAALAAHLAPGDWFLNPVTGERMLVVPWAAWPHNSGPASQAPVIIGHGASSAVQVPYKRGDLKGLGTTGGFNIGDKVWLPDSTEILTVVGAQSWPDGDVVKVTGPVGDAYVSPDALQKVATMEKVEMPPDKPSPESMPSSMLQVGDEFTIKSAAATGATFKFVAPPKPGVAAQIVMVGGKNAGKQYAWGDEGEWPDVKVLVSHFETKVAKPVSSLAPPDDEVPWHELSGYASAWGSHGSYKHQPIDTLGPGEVFRDKTGDKFVFSHATTEHAVVRREPTGEWLRVSLKMVNNKGVWSPMRVRVVS